MLELLRFYVVVKEIILSFLVVFGCIKTSRKIYLAFNMLSSISDLEYFCSSNIFFQFFEAFFFYIFIFSDDSPLQRRTVCLLNSDVGSLTYVGDIVLNLLVCCEYPSRFLYQFYLSYLKKVILFGLTFLHNDFNIIIDLI